MLIISVRVFLKLFSMESFLIFWTVIPKFFLIVFPKVLQKISESFLIIFLKFLKNVMTFSYNSLNIFIKSLIIFIHFLKISGTFSLKLPGKYS